jgi:hypothetical protein
MKKYWFHITDQDWPSKIVLEPKLYGDNWGPDEAGPSRISVAPTIEQCFAAVPYSEYDTDYQVFKTEQQVDAEPADNDIIGDFAITNEHWLFEPTSFIKVFTVPREDLNNFPSFKSWEMSKKRQLVVLAFVKDYLKQKHMISENRITKRLFKTLIREIVKQYLREVRLSGEFWIDDSGSAWSADGDIGDINHEGMVIETVTREVLDLLGIDASNHEYVNIDDQFDEIYNNIKDNLSETQLERWQDGDTMEIIEEYLKTLNVEHLNEKLNVIKGGMDARDYGMKFLGWIRLKSNNIQVETLTRDDINSIVKGLWDAYGYEIENTPEDGEEDSEGITFNIEVNSTRSWYEDVPMSVLEKRDPTALNPYRTRF